MLLDILPLDTKAPMMNSMTTRILIFESMARFKIFFANSMELFLIYIVKNTFSVAS